MRMNGSFFEQGNDLITLFVEQDANSDVTGDWLSLKHYSRAMVFLLKAGSEDVDDLSLELKQATDSSGTSSKALTVSKYWYKTGTLTSQGTWTRGTHDTAATGLAFGSSVPTGHTRTVDDVNTNPMLLACEIEAAALDVDNVFDWFTAFIEGDNVNNSCLLTSWAILMEGRFKQAVPVNAIA